MKKDLKQKQKEWLESIPADWFYELGYDTSVMYRIQWIIEHEVYEEWDISILNEIRDCWLRGVKMRI